MTRPRRAIVTALLLAILCLALYAGRNEIARGVARDWLARRHIASAIDIRDLSLSGLSASLSLGNRARPDLTVRRIEVRYAITGPWAGRSLGVEARAITLFSPRLAGRWDGRRLSFGALDPLIAELRRRPPNPRQPLPTVTVRDGFVRLSTPCGFLDVLGDGQVERGVLSRFDGRLGPARLKCGGLIVATAGGPLHLGGAGGALSLKASAPVDAVLPGGATLRVARLSLQGAAPYPDGRRPAGGPLTFTLTGGGSVQGGGLAVTPADLRVSFEGDTRFADHGGFSVLGALNLDADGALAVTGGTTLRGGRLHLALSGLRIEGSAGRVLVSGAGVGAARADKVRGAGVAAGGLAGALTLGRFEGGIDKAGLHWRAAFKASAQARLVRWNGWTLAGLRAGLNGSTNDGALDAEAQAAGTVRLGPARAARLAGAVPILAGEPPYRVAMTRALSGMQVAAPRLHVAWSGPRASVALLAPLRLSAASGAIMTLTARPGASLGQTRGGAWDGAFAATLAGGGMPKLDVAVSRWTERAGVTRAQLAAAGELDALFARGARLQARGLATLAGGDSRFELDHCEPEFARHLVIGAIEVADFSGRVCPALGPLISAGPAGWRIRGRLEGAGGLLLLPQARVGDGSARFDLSGGAKGPREGTVDTIRARVRDAQGAPRFEPLETTGRLDLAVGTWRGNLVVLTRSGRPVAAIGVRHDLASGIGGVQIDAQELVFAKGGLQPAELSPLAAFARDAEGRAVFRGHFDWTPAGMVSGGQLSTGGLNFRSPLGMATGVVGAVKFISLAPLTTAPDQSLSIARIDALAPLEHLVARFAFDDKAITVNAASVNVAKGRVGLEPLVVSFAPGGTVRGAADLERVDLGDLVAASSLAKAVKIDAVVDGRLPFEVGPGGFSLLEGHIAAVKPGRISISPSALKGVQTSTPSAGAEASPNAIQGLAYQALENLAFDQLDATLASHPDGRLGVLFHIRGRHDPPTKQEATISLLDLLKGTAFKRSIPLPSGVPINLTLDTSLNFSQIIAALRDIWEKSTASSATHSAPVQPPGG
ncbi:MAG: YdbH domain-containing protein [Caulobacteraceae bacterium]